MQLFLILYVNVLALFFIQKRFFVRDLTEGVGFFISSCLLTIVPFLLATWFPLELHLVVKIFFTCSIVAALYCLLDAKVRQIHWRHPIYVFPLIFLAILLVFGETKYVVQLGDETSHWMLMPKQMFSFQKFGSNDFFFKPFMTYTPGWTFLKAYPSLLLYKFGVNEFMWRGVTYLSLFYFFSLLFLIYDLFTSFRFRFLPQRLVTTTAFVLLLTVTCMRPFGLVFSTHIAIELPLNFSYIACLLILWAIAVKIFTLHRGFIYLGIMLTHAYLLKTPAALLLLPSILGLALLCRRENVSIADTAKYFAFLTVGFVTVYLTWRTYTSEFPLLFAGPKGAWQRIQQNAYLIKDMLQNLTHFFIFGLDSSPNGASYHLIYKKVFNTIALSFLLFEVIKKRNRIVIAGGFILFMAYFLGLYYMYMASFGSVEGTALASFGRYMGSAIITNRSLALFLMVFYLLDVEWVVKLWQRVLDHMVSKLAVFSILLIGISYQAYTAYYSPAHARVPHPTIVNARKLVDVLKEHDMLGSTVRIIAQGQANESWLAANYASISSRPGVDQHFKPMVEISWPLDENLLVEGKSREELIKELIGHDVLWVEVSDERMNRLLSQVIDTASCPAPFEQYFFLNKNDDLECVKKHWEPKLGASAQEKLPGE